jgi:hypothetical protein
MFENQGITFSHIFHLQIDISFSFFVIFSCIHFLALYSCDVFFAFYCCCCCCCVVVVVVVVVCYNKLFDCFSLLGSCVGHHQVVFLVVASIKSHTVSDSRGTGSDSRRGQKVGNDLLGFFFKNLL